jgi:hypothetical protein
MVENSAETNVGSKEGDGDGATSVVDGADVPHHHVDGNGGKDIMGSSDAVAVAAVALATSVQTASTAANRWVYLQQAYSYAYSKLVNSIPNII